MRPGSIPLALLLASSASAQLYPARSFHVGEGSSDVAYADLNGDGWLDLVSSHYNHDAAAILFGVGEGCFGPRHDIGESDNFSDVALGDLDGDADVDVMLFSSESPYGLEVWLGDGAGAFAQAATIPLPYGYEDALLDDFDGDLLPDLVALNTATRVVTFLKGDGAGGFTVGADYPTGSGQPHAIVQADFDEDGEADVVTLNNGDMGLMLGDGAGGFGAATLFPATGGTPIVVDWNVDGHADVLLSAPGQSLIRVLLGDGAGDFTPTTLDPNGAVGDLAVGDLNGDQQLDIASSASEETTLVFGDGAGGILATRNFPGADAPPALLDTDGDGDLDLVNSGRRVTIHLNDGAGRFAGRLVDKGGVSGSDTSLALAHLDGDGVLDAVASRRFGDGLTVRLGNGHWGFESATEIWLGSGVGPIEVAVGDFDGDTRNDLVTANETSGDVSLLLGLGGGTFAAPTFTPVGSEPSALEIADLNADGALDVVVANRSPGQVVVLLGDGAGGFVATPYSTIVNAVSDVAIGDLNLDGHLDAVVTLETFLGSVAVLLGDGTGALGAATIFSVSDLVGSYPTSLALGDLDGDGDEDLAVANEGRDALTVLKGSGDGTFGSPQFYLASGERPEAVRLVDVDGDTRLDLVASSYRGGVSVRLGTGSGTFGLERNHGLFVNEPHALRAGDLNGDGRPELVAGLSGGYEVAVLPHLGGAPACACGTERFCYAAANTAHPDGAHIGSTGSLSLAANDFGLTVSDAIPGQFGLFFYGLERVVLPLGDGWRCVGGPLYRVGAPVLVDGAGFAEFSVDFTQPPMNGGSGAVLSGVPWGFQCWYRDPQDTAGYNLSDGLQVVFCR